MTLALDLLADGEEALSRAADLLVGLDGFENLLWRKLNGHGGADCAWGPQVLSV